MRTMLGSALVAALSVSPALAQTVRLPDAPGPLRESAMRMARAGGAQQRQTRTQEHWALNTAGFVLGVIWMAMPKGAIRDASECRDPMIQAGTLDGGYAAFAASSLNIVYFKCDNAELPKAE